MAPLWEFLHIKYINTPNSIKNGGNRRNRLQTSTTFFPISRLNPNSWKFLFKLVTGECHWLIPTSTFEVLEVKLPSTHETPGCQNRGSIRVQGAKGQREHWYCQGCTHPAGEVPLHEPLHEELGLEGDDEGREGLDGEPLHQRLVLVDHGPPAVLQDQQPHVPGNTSTAPQQLLPARDASPGCRQGQGSQEPWLTVPSPLLASVTAGVWPAELLGLPSCEQSLEQALAAQSRDPSAPQLSLSLCCPPPELTWPESRV